LSSLKYTALASVIIAGLLWQPRIVLAACEDYASQAEAQQALRDDPDDPERLDPDGNGIACERFAPPYDREPVPRPNVTPMPQATPTPADDEPEEPEDVDSGSDELPEDPSDEATPAPTPAPRPPELGPIPPPLSALQGGTAIGPLPAVQGGNGGAYPPGTTVTGTAIQPPNTGDGGLLR
jgi:hypothetical protein